MRSELKQEKLNESLYKAAKSGDFEQVKNLIESGADIKYCSKSKGRTVLWYAKANSHEEIANYLQKKLNDQLLDTVQSGDITTFDMLLHAGASKETIDDDGCDLVTNALWHFKPSSRKQILEHMSSLEFDIDNSNIAAMVRKKLLSAVKNKQMQEVCLDKIYHRIALIGVKTKIKIIKEDLFLKDIGTIELAKALTHDDCVTTLDLSSQQIGDDGMLELAKMLETNNTITVLNLGSNKIGIRGVRALTEVLKSNQSLQTISLQNNSLSDKCARSLAHGLKFNTTLKNLNVSHNGITDKGAKRFATSVEVNKSLTNLDLSYNPIGKEGIYNLAFIMMKHNSLINILLNGNKICVNSAIINQLGKCTSEEINLSGISMGSFEINLLLDMLRYQKNKIKLNLSNCGIGKLNTEIISLLADMLKDNHSIVEIDLSKNEISGEVARILIESLKNNTEIIGVDLSGNLLRNSETIILADTLKVNTSITSLELSDSKIGDEGAKALANVLRYNKYISKINLAGNEIGDVGAEELSNVLINSTSVKRIGLESNIIEKHGLKKLMLVILGNNSVTKLSLFDRNGNFTRADVSSYYQKTIHAIIGCLLIQKNSQVTEAVFKDRLNYRYSESLLELLDSNLSKISVNLCCENLESIIDKLADVLKRNNSIVKLDLSRNSITPAGMRVLMAALKVNRSITEIAFPKLAERKLLDKQTIQPLLDLIRYNHNITKIHPPAMNEEAYAALSDTLKSTSITGLYCGMGYGEPYETKAITSMLKENRKITEISIPVPKTKNNEAIRLVADALHVNTSLTKISLRKLDEEESQIFADALKVNQQNKIREIKCDTGGYAFADLLRVNNQIKEITSTANEFRHIADGLKHNESVTTLKVGLNNVSLMSLSELLKHNTTIASITSLDCSSVKDLTEGIKSLTNTLKMRNFVKEIDFSTLHITDDQAEFLAEALKYNQSITILSINIRDLSERGIKSLTEALKVNRTLQILKLEENYYRSVTRELRQEIANLYRANNTLVDYPGQINHYPFRYNFWGGRDVMIQKLIETCNNIQMAHKKEQISKSVYFQPSPILLTEDNYDDYDIESGVSEDYSESKSEDSSDSSDQSIEFSHPQTEQVNLSQSERERIEKVFNEIVKIRDELGTIDSKFKLTTQDQHEKQHISANRKLNSYYETMRQNFNQAFAVAVVLSTGKIAAEEGKVTKIANFISSLGSSLTIGAGILAASSAEISKIRRTGRYTHLTDIVKSSDPTEIGIFCERLARAMTLTQERQIIYSDDKNISSITNELNGFCRHQLGKISDSFARGVFNEHKTPEQLLSSYDSKTGLEHVLSGTLERNLSTSKQFADFNSKIHAVVKDIVKEVTGKLPTRLDSATFQENQNSGQNNSRTGVSDAAASKKELSELYVKFEEERTRNNRLEKLLKQAREDAAQAKQAAEQSKKVQDALLEQVDIDANGKIQTIYRTRDRVTIRVINPKLEEHISSINDRLGIQEERADGFEADIYRTSSHVDRLSRNQNQQCCVIS